jgi:hypothetical protein
MDNNSITLKHIEATKRYLEYLDEHIRNVNKAYENVSYNCRDMRVIYNKDTHDELREQVLTHDLSKLSRHEFTQYREAFFPVGDKVRLQDSAWEHHLDNNAHHWQSIMRNTKPMKQQEVNLMHMVIDWTAKSYKFGGSAESYFKKEEKANKIILTDKYKYYLYEIFNRMD